MSSDRGSATVWAAAVVAVLLTVTGFAATVGAVATLRHRAAAAADVAALAAAGHVLDGPADACPRARAAAGADAGRLVSCRVDGAVAAVTVTVAAPSWLSWVGSVTGQARAGPTLPSTEEPPRAGRRRNLARSASLSLAGRRRGEEHTRWAGTGRAD